ncbi:MAG TPA: hypothetical protein VE172_01045 [Stackebrandtia sp.]|uniref:hypothetical protein n=1 Tax=Stackebrandtia sp. TaxID=2023065 RepID=UPI002D2EA1A0|nr:hypothetical protein [Stackebrandtia sp.]HZE37377.1 hypothetical protein [Stackebrandtia sp.]
MESRVSILGREAGRVAAQVAHWTPARWHVHPDAAARRTRGDIMHGLVQELADLGAEAEGLPRHAVPRLPHDTVLADQLRVVTADLCAARPRETTVEAALSAVSRAHSALF